MSFPEARHEGNRHSKGLQNGSGIGAICFTNCALIARQSDWAEELENLGVRLFKRPESLYKTLRSRSFLPEVCIVDLDSVPRNLVKAVDIRIPCPKVWIGKTAANPADIKNFGIYYSKATADELNSVVGSLIETDQSTMLPVGIVGKQTFPLLVADKSYRERLHHYTEVSSGTNLITLHGDDPLELQLVAQYLAIGTLRARLWEVKSEASIHAMLRKIAQARRPGTDVTILLSGDVDTESAREFHESLPDEYAMIKISARSDNPVGSLSFTLPRPADRPVDIANWINWFVCRATIEYGIALSGLSGLIQSINHMLGQNPTIEQIRGLSERLVRQHATMMEDQGEYMSYEDLVHNFERTVLRRALVQHNWNLSATAKSLGLAESSLRYKLNKLGVTKRNASD
jgi:hypothetical protein